LLPPGDIPKGTGFIQVSMTSNDKNKPVTATFKLPGNFSILSGRSYQYSVVVNDKDILVQMVGDDENTEPQIQAWDTTEPNINADNDVSID
jgi:hypothetical protein